MYEQWLVTTQTTTVSEYQRRFIEIATPLDRVREKILLGHFVNGLKEKIKAEIRLLNPLSLERAMELAMRVGKKNRVMGYKKQGLGLSKSRPYSLYKYTNYKCTIVLSL